MVGSCVFATGEMQQLRRNRGLPVTAQVAYQWPSDHWLSRAQPVSPCCGMPLPHRVGANYEEEEDLLRGRWRRVGLPPVPNMFPHSHGHGVAILIVDLLHPEVPRLRIPHLSAPLSNDQAKERANKP